MSFFRPLQNVLLQIHHGSSLAILWSLQQKTMQHEIIKSLRIMFLVSLTYAATFVIGPVLIIQVNL